MVKQIYKELFETPPASVHSLCNGFFKLFTDYACKATIYWPNATPLVAIFENMFQNFNSGTTIYIIQTFKGWHWYLFIKRRELGYIWHVLIELHVSAWNNKRTKLRYRLDAILYVNSQCCENVQSIA